MGVYNVHGGHNFIVPGAKGLLDETAEDRKVTARVISALRSAGHTVYDCTDDSGRTQGQNLANIVAKCNAHPVDLNISNHLNAGGGTGVEVWCYDDQNDASHWNADKCGDAIASAIAGKTVTGTTSSGSAPVTTSVAKPATSTGNDWVRRLQTECNTQGFSNQKVDGIPGKNTLAGCPTCRKGARGNITRLIQERLNSLGFNCGKVDGIFGNGTRAAVIAFQKAHGLSADGIVGQNTWRALLGL